MKLLLALLFGLSSAALAQTPTADQRSTTFNFNQSSLSLSLDQKDFQTIYRTDQVASTCYRDEVQGTRASCHTEYDRACHLENRLECNNIPRRICHNTTNCYNVPDRVCNSHGCTTINRRVCNPSQSCSTTMDRVCHNESRNVCENIPRQACVQVPNVVQVPYTCMQPVQVPIGQELKLHTVAQIAVNLVNFAEVGATPDVLLAQLNGGMVFITAQNAATNSFIYQIVDQQRTEQMASATEKVVTYSISVTATSIQKLNAFLNSQIINTHLFVDHLDFSIIGSMNVPLKGHLKAVEYYRRRQYIIIDADFPSTALVAQNEVQHLSFNTFETKILEPATHLIELSLSIDLAKLQGGLINPGALAQVSSKAVLSSFEAFPNQ